jgi:2-(1,2-epoxy-1,2-dihydrophenyl)acetyl-CoA isomerase
LGQITFEHVDGVTLLRFNRAQQLNAFSQPMYQLLLRNIEQFAADEAQRVLLITGAGRAFCAGQDLNEIDELGKRSSDELGVAVGQLQHITRLMCSTHKPMIAAINGPAVGFGAELTLACDMRLAAQSAYFMFPEIERGLFFTNAATLLLPAAVGPTLATYLLLTGERLTAQEALAAGLISQLLPDEQLLDRAWTLARRLCSLNPESVALTLEGLHLHRAAALEDALRFETSACIRLARR